MRGFVRAAMGRQGGEIALLILSMVGLYFFAYRGMRFFLVPSASMAPTLLKGDYIVTLKESYYRRGDIVVLKDPEESGGYIVKRVAALGGDTVAVLGGALFVNGDYVSEPYTMEPALYTMAPVRVPEGTAFLLGDNRNDSDDSHLWKTREQPVASFIGRVRLIYYPYTRAGGVPRYPPVTADRDLLREDANMM